MAVGIFYALNDPLPQYVAASLGRGELWLKQTGQKNTGKAHELKEAMSNMAKITVVGDAIVITSAKSLEDIQKLEKYRPKALKLFEADENGKKEEAFRVCTVKEGGSISRHGAAFGSATRDEQGLATITMTIPQGVEDAQEYALEKIGTAIISLNKVEAQFDAALADIESDVAAVKAAITVL